MTTKTNNLTLKQLITRDNVRSSATFTGENLAMKPSDSASQQEKGWYQSANHFQVTLKRKRRTMTVPFSQGSGISGEPDAHSVLSCLLSDSNDDYSSFESWASNLSYDPDSRKAERIFQASITQTKRLRRFLADSFDEYQRSEY